MVEILKAALLAGPKLQYVSSQICLESGRCWHNGACKQPFFPCVLELFRIQQPQRGQKAWDVYGTINTFKQGACISYKREPMEKGKEMGGGVVRGGGGGVDA